MHDGKDGTRELDEQYYLYNLSISAENDSREARHGNATETRGIRDEVPSGAPQKHLNGSNTTGAERLPTVSAPVDAQSTASKGQTGRTLKNCFSSAEAYRILLVACMINVFFLALGTSLSQLDRPGGGCTTFWGEKNDCDTVSYTLRTQFLPCKPIMARLQAGAAMTILSIIIMLVVTLLLLKMAVETRWMTVTKQFGYTPTCEPFQYLCARLPGNFKWYCVAAISFALFLELLSCSMTASIHLSNFCGGEMHPKSETYGVGFGLLLTGWLVGVLTVPLFAVYA
ncbi:putative Amastin surface glycoprotein [Trypanosoma vivax]|uniref:Amastin n=1 Tax=Trypanosoma vivax (strain Y486) TaxID=1055687 RepID=G0UC90_TRYVY|nr:hypothetical protein TRVL_01169 [Trypanosoma vivax]KAH8609573.1 putative Amastin surface glycoprotein [Trypanosoma vivax]CCC53440.1 conserved hypothetical protein [Trypanosoma vivax Y486]